MQFAIWSYFSFDKLFGFFIIADSVSLSMKDHHRVVKLMHILLNLGHSFEQRFGHFGTQKRQHQPVLENVVQIFIVLCQSSRIYHCVYYQILKVVSHQLHKIKFSLWKMPICRQTKERTCQNTTTDRKVRSGDQQLSSNEASHAMSIHK